MQGLIIGRAVAILVHVDTSAQVPKLRSQLIWDALSYNFAESFALLLIKEEPVIHHLFDSASILRWIHRLSIGLLPETERQLIILRFHEALPLGDLRDEAGFSLLLNLLLLYLLRRFLNNFNHDYYIRKFPLSFIIIII